MSDKDPKPGTPKPPEGDPTERAAATVKAPAKVGNMVTPLGESVPLTTPGAVGSLTKIDDLDALTFRGASEDQAPDAGTASTEEIKPIQLRSGETGKSRTDGPAGRRWQSDVPMNPNQILLNEAPKPDVVDDGIPVEQ